MRKVVFVQGGGVGLDQEASVRAILNAVGAEIEFEVILAGRAAVEAGCEPLSSDLFDTIRAAGVALKTRLHPSHETYRGKRPPSVTLGLDYLLLADSTPMV